MDILLLVVFAIGAIAMLAWCFRQVRKAYRYLFMPRADDYLMNVSRIDWTTYKEELTPWRDLPKYKGVTGWFGLPGYRDVMVPNKHNYASVAYMDTPVKQFVYDVMAYWKENNLRNGGDAKFFWIAIVLIGVAYIIKPPLVWLVAFFLLWLVLWMGPTGQRAARRSAERFRHFKPDDWRKVYRQVAESKEREDEIVSALRRGGGVGRVGVGRFGAGLFK